MTEDKVCPVSEWKTCEGDFYPPSSTTSLSDIDQLDEKEFFRGLERYKQFCDNPLHIFQPDTGFELLVGIDAEWERVGDSNRVLSFQIHVPMQPCLRLLLGDSARSSLASRVARLSSFTLVDDADRPPLKILLVRLIRKALRLGVLSGVPEKIVVVGFGLRFDLAVLGDFGKIKNVVDGVAGKLMTVHDETEIDFSWRARPRVGVVPSSNPRSDSELPSNLIASHEMYRYSVKIRFVDIATYAPSGTNLRAIGALVDLPKLDIPHPYSIEKMSHYLAHDPDGFKAYAMRDAEITVAFYIRILKLCQSIIPIKTLPPTASSFSVKWFKNTIGQDDYLRFFGLQCIKKQKWNEKSGKVVSSQSIEHCELRSLHEPFFIKCYHGGRNESFWLGPTPPSFGTITDFDLTGAYTTGLVDLHGLDYSSVRPTTDLSELLTAKVGFALVDFCYPDGTRVPGLPVRTDLYGLIFPLSGTSYATAPEIQVAHANGCRMRVLHGVVFPNPIHDGCEDRVFATFVKRVRELRSFYKKAEIERAAQLGIEPGSSLEEGLIKLFGNGLYGKTSQGLRPKNVYNTRSRQSEPLITSSVTSAAIAAHATGFIRAVLAELLSSIPESHIIVSATTDGFLTSADLSDINLSGPMCKRFDQLCQWVLPGSKMLEVKHRVGQVLAIKTRGQLTLNPEPASRDYLDNGVLKRAGSSIVLARTGVQVSVDALPESDAELIRRLQNESMIDLYLNRTPQSQGVVKSFPTLRDQIEKDKDMVAQIRLTRLSLEPDLKRDLTDPIETQIYNRSSVHLSADTVPWRSVDDFIDSRLLLEKFRSKRCLKTAKDFLDFRESLSAGLVRRAAKRKGEPVMNLGSGTSLDLFRRSFLRGVSRNMLGVEIALKGAELAELLTSFGCRTSLTQVKDAGRKKTQFVPHAVPRTVEVLALCDLLRLRFPGVDLDVLLIQDETA